MCAVWGPPTKHRWAAAAAVVTAATARQPQRQQQQLSVRSCVPVSRCGNCFPASHASRADCLLWLLVPCCAPCACRYSKPCRTTCRWSKPCSARWCLNAPLAPGPKRPPAGAQAGPGAGHSPVWPSANGVTTPPTSDVMALAGAVSHLQ